MEKTIQITIGSTLFQLTESAYEKLSRYLDGLKAHFRTEEDGEEILRDIEARIAEKLLESKKTLITEKDIAAVIAEMGDSSQFKEETTEPTHTVVSGDKKLYRDPDNAIIAGVAAGLGAFFNVNIFVIRLLFVVSIFFGGTGIFMYLLLWLLIPEAKTAGQKLEMKGSAVTLDSISRMVKDRVEETKQRGTFERILYLPFQILGAGVRFICTRVAPALGTLIGIVLSIASFFALIGLTIALGVIIANWNAPYNDFPLRDAVSGWLLSLAFAAGFIAIAIPLVFIFTLGVRLFKRKTILSSSVGFGLVGVWALSVIVGAVTISKIVGEYYTYTQTHPDFAVTTQIHNLDTFSKVFIESEHVTFVNGTTTKIMLEGRVRDMGNIDAQVENGTFTIAPKDINTMCMFCSHNAPAITVMVPTVSTLELSNADATFENYEARVLDIKARNASIRGDITAVTLTTASVHSSIRSQFIVQNLTVTAENSWLNFSGSAQDATITLDHSSLDAESFVIKNTTITLDNSVAEVHITETLKQTEDRASHITVKGNPQITQ